MFRLKKNIPLLGILLYMVFYVYASSLYPGGSQADGSSRGFDWVNNYWCNLMNKNALNGLSNPARFYAILANLILSFVMGYFFFSMPGKLDLGRIWDKVTPIAGIISMILAGLLYTDYHDIVSVMSGFFGVIALAGVFNGLIRARWWALIISGLGCGTLILLNNVIYFSGFGLSWLPLIQKITMIYIFLWVLSVHGTEPSRPSH